MKSQNLRGLARNGLIAAAYAALSLALTPFTFGQVQCRVSEALTLLPVLCPSSVWGVTLGCVVTNLVGASAGTNFLGIADVFLGSAATLAAGLMTAGWVNTAGKDFLCWPAFLPCCSMPLWWEENGAM